MKYSGLVKRSVTRPARVKTLTPAWARMAKVLYALEPYTAVSVYSRARPDIESVYC